MVNNLLIMNLHTHNFGDEALGKALVNKLLSENLFNKLDILYTHNNEIKDKGFIEYDDETSISQHASLKSSVLQKITIRVLLLLPFKLSRFLTKYSLYKREAQLIESSDFIISAPGGVNIGPYMDWTYLWRLYYAVKIGKKIAIYSISFGPLPSNKLFKKCSEYVLKNVNFLALRDQKSQKLAEEMKLNFIPSIDTTFLDNKNYSSLFENINLNKPYVVITPNELYRWHKKYQSFTEDRITQIYLSIIAKLLNLDLNIVILPHLFGYQYDDLYIEKIISRLPAKKNITTFQSIQLNSDTVQAIISNAEFVIGSRFHTIMFAIKYRVPFFALSYEHKIMNTLTELNLENLALDFYEELINENDDSISQIVIDTYKTRQNYVPILENASDIASNIAISVYEKLFKIIK